VFTNNRLGVIDTTTYNLQILQHSEDVYWMSHPEDISFSDNGKYAYVTWDDGFVQTLDADTNNTTSIDPEYSFNCSEFNCSSWLDYDFWM